MPKRVVSGLTIGMQFQEEVELAGQNPNAYGYDYQNQLIFLKPVTQFQRIIQAQNNKQQKIVDYTNKNKNSLLIMLLVM
jgi:hypothetical protein